jgi:hypothetical protein
MSGLTILSSVFKALKFIWPFIAEMFFAGRSIKQIIIENKFALFLIIFLASSLFLNYISFSKIYEIAIARRENDVQKKVLDNKAKKDKPTVEEPYPPNSPAPSSSTPSGTMDPHETVRQRLERIYRADK